MQTPLPSRIQTPSRPLLPGDWPLRVGRLEDQGLGVSPSSTPSLGPSAPRHEPKEHHSFSPPHASLCVPVSVHTANAHLRSH